ncbi:hypothetical protein BDZ85DRAFT_104289 [Elsinoe ampelina]|uniref:Secreted protein n=1 Tax=Elsinoe ampelina TaxID=302913 RepID=A0A6A6GGE9_9PEZI|nr:hypothetical protein BDZ85DRAFT_104289 [Elsinoe ampelina]
MKTTSMIAAIDFLFISATSAAALPVEITSSEVAAADLGKRDCPNCYCYGSGEQSSQGVAEGWARDACSANQGMFTGWYNPPQTKAMCPRDNGLGYVFELQNLNNREGFDINDYDCINKLTELIWFCPRGGEQTVAGWRFRVDPGNC